MQALNDDRQSHYSAWRIKWSQHQDKGASLLKKRLKKQFAERAEEPNLNLTSDEKALAQNCAKILQQNLALPHARFLLEDPLDMIGAIDNEGFVDALVEMERTYKLELINWETKSKTFRDLIHYIYCNRNTLTFKDIYQRHNFGLIAWILFILALNIYTTVKIFSEYNLGGLIEELKNPTLSIRPILTFLFHSFVLIILWLYLFALIRERLSYRIKPKNQSS